MQLYLRLTASHFDFSIDFDLTFFACCFCMYNFHKNFDAYTLFLAGR